MMELLLLWTLLPMQRQPQNSLPGSAAVQRAHLSEPASPARRPCRADASWCRRRRQRERRRPESPWMARRKKESVAATSRTGTRAWTRRTKLEVPLSVLDSGRVGHTLSVCCHLQSLPAQRSRPSSIAPGVQGGARRWRPAPRQFATRLAPRCSTAGSQSIRSRRRSFSNH